MTVSTFSKIFFEVVTMGIFDKLKQVLGIGTVKVKMEVDKSFSKSENSISGSLSLNAKSDQEIISLEVKLEEVWEKGRDDNKVTKTFDLGEWVDKTPFSMKAGESKTIPFSLTYALVKSKNDDLQESAGKVGKALGGLGKMMDAEKSSYSLIATCDVKGAAFDPNDVQEMKLIG